MFLGAPYVFSERLLVGVIKKRPNRFVMMVNVSGSLERVHCPCTGNIGNLDFEDSNIPCLLSINHSKTAKTSHTVEAISLGNPDDAEFNWIGINQNRANRIVEHFLKAGALFGFKTKTSSRKRKLGDDDIVVKREVKIGSSRIDFQVDFKGVRYLIEVKTPLQWGMGSENLQVREEEFCIDVEREASKTFW